MKEFLLEYWNDLLVAFVGLSAIAAYLMQKRDEYRAAATMIVNQVNIIEKRVERLKDDNQLGNIAVYHSKVIIKDNAWERYKHLFTKKLSDSEYELIQLFFDQAEQLEKARQGVVAVLEDNWRSKTDALQSAIGTIVLENPKEYDARVQAFYNTFPPLEYTFTPNVVMVSLTKALNNHIVILGTTAYAKLEKVSYK